MSETARDLLGQTLARLEGATADGEPRWLASLRHEAAGRLRERGLPTQKDEAWRFTPVRPVVSVPFQPAPAALDTETRRALAAQAGELGYALWLDNGRPTGLGRADLPEGVEARSLADVLEHEPDRVEPHLGRLVRAENGFSAQNAALFDDGLVLFVRRGADVARPLHVIHAAVASEAPTVASPRVLVVLESSSRLSLIESHVGTGPGRHLENGVTEIGVGDNAELDHVRVYHGRPHHYAVATTAVRQQRDSRYRSRVFTFGGELARLDLHVVLDGAGAECTLDGLYLARSGDHVDHHTLVEHPTPRASSRQRYKGVLDDKGYGVFDGIVQVARGAAGTEAHQQNRNLLLSPEAVVHTKPHLEIDADDVQCTHGATVGRLDAEQLFYLRSRGIDEAAARATLTHAFAREVVDRLDDGAVRDHITANILSWLPQGDFVRALQ